MAATKPAIEHTLESVEVAEVDGLGLQLFDLLTLPRTNGLLYQVDAVFVRKTSPLWARTAR